MAKTKETVKEIKKVASAPVVETPVVVAPILPLTQNFGNEELHTLRDKINEIIARG